jgi:AraC-like DNA-binding protein
MMIKNKRQLAHLYELSSIPVCVIDDQGKMLLGFPMDGIPLLNDRIITLCLRKFIPPPPHPPTILSAENINFWGFAELTPEKYLIFGPARQKRGYRLFVTTMSLAIFLCTGKSIPTEDITLENPAASGQEPEAALQEWFFVQRESSISHISHNFERGILDAVEIGDIPLLKKRFMEPAIGRVGKMSNNTLQQERYTFVAFATLLARAAIRGGLDDEMGYSLSDTWCRQMDSMTTIQDINSLSYKMALDFCQKIAHEGKKEGFSPTIRKLCSYISIHLHEEISLADLSSVSGLCGRSLSKKFRDALGVSIADYIHQQKMREAVHLLLHSEYDIADIAEFLNYNSQSYFTKIFREIYEITPKQYQEKHGQRTSKKEE